MWSKTHTVNVSITEITETMEAKVLADPGGSSPFTKVDTNNPATSIEVTREDSVA